MTVYRFDAAIWAWMQEGERVARQGGPADPAGSAGFPEEAEAVLQARAGYRRACRHFAAPHPIGLTTEDRAIGGVACRIYRPARADGGCILWFHGGGWTVGDLDTHDSVVADLAHGAGSVAIAVDYRLAPEHPFPAAFDDALAVFSAVRAAPPASIDRERILVAGDSAGGNLAASVAQACRDQGLPLPYGQLLIYPALSGDSTLPSRRLMADAPGLSSADMLHFLEVYLGRPLEDADLTDARLFPAGAADLRGLPPAFLTAAEYDPLASDVTAHAAGLRAAGVPVEAIVEAGLPHAWLRARHHARPAAAAFARLVDAARRLGRAR